MTTSNAVKPDAAVVDDAMSPAFVELLVAQARMMSAAPY